MIPFPSLFEAFQWWMRTAGDRPVSVLIDDPELRRAAPYGVRRTIYRDRSGWRARHA